MGVYTTLSLILIIFIIILIYCFLKLERFTETGVILPVIAFISFFIINSVGLAIFKSFDNNSESLVFVFIVYIAMLSFFFGYHLMPQRGSNRKLFLSLKIFKLKSDNYYKRGFICLFLLVFAISLLFNGGFPELLLGLVEILSDSTDLSTNESGSYLSEQRFMITKSHLYGGDYSGQGILKELQQTGWRFVTVFSLIGFIHWKNRFWRFSFIVSLILMILFLIGTGERAPLVFSILSLLIAYSFSKKLNIRQISVILFYAFTLLFLISIPMSRGVSELLNLESYLELFKSLNNRIFMGNGIHDVEVIEWVNSGKLEIRYGLFHFEKLISSFPSVNVGTPLGNVISDLRGSKLGVFSSGTYLGFVYADFSYIGVPILYFFMGLFIRNLNTMILATKKEILNISFIVLIIFTSGEMTSYGFIGFFVNSFIIFLFYKFFKFTGNLLSNNYN